MPRLISGASALTRSTGSILQVKYTQFTGTNQVTSTAYASTAVTDLTVNITPTATNSIIKIQAMVNGEWSTASGATESTWFFLRDTTKLSIAAASNRSVGILMGTSITYFLEDHDSSPEHASYSYFDSPNSTSQITYKVAFNNTYGATWSLNRTDGDSDTASYERGLSYISATEIAG
tara:strand:- start:35 stop:565 length:531 start_codon:yes stop_codon:yes gene_type:complete